MDEVKASDIRVGDYVHIANEFWLVISINQSVDKLTIRPYKSFTIFSNKRGICKHACYCEALINTLICYN